MKLRKLETHLQQKGREKGLQLVSAFVHPFKSADVIRETTAAAAAGARVLSNKQQREYRRRDVARAAPLLP